MHFFFDESGDFAAPSDASEHRAAVAVGLAVSNTIEPEFRSSFLEFESGRSNAERSRGEVKGHLLSRASRSEFCDLLNSLGGISLTPVTLDLSSVTPSYRDGFARDMQRRLVNYAETMVHATAREELRLLARQFGNLSASQALRIYTWTNCIREAIQHALIYLASGAHADSWLRPAFELDRVQTRPGCREEQVSSVMIYAWLQGWTSRVPLILVEEVHTNDHPFVREYDDGEVIDLSKLVRRNLRWVDSSESWGVRAADIAANIVYSAVVDLDDRNGNASMYSSLMRSSYYGHVRGPGLFSPMTEVPDAVAAKYMLLAEVMKRNEHRPA